MIDIFRGYVVTKDKKPIQKFKGVDVLPTLEEVSKYDEYAGILNDEFTVMDVDDATEAEIALKIVQDRHFNCKVVNTSRGKHFIFKKSKFASKGNTHQVNAFGLTFDIRTGINQYIVVKKDGVLREVVQDFDEAKPIAEYPMCFAPIKCDAKFVGMGDGDGRNGALFTHIATLFRNGFDKDDIIDIICEINEFCFSEPLADAELKTLLRDDSFTNLKRVSVEDDFGKPIDLTTTYKPKNFSDLAMAELFAAHYAETIRYNPGTDWLVWNGKLWEASELKAIKKYTEFLKKVLKQAQNEINALYAGGIPDKEELAKAQAFYNYVIKMSDGGKISSVLKIARSFLEIDINELDANPFDLNTLDGIIDLKTGIIRPHEASAMCTKITKSVLKDGNDALWLNLLKLITQDDSEYIDYLQVLCGTFTIGKIYTESLCIAQGAGSNGKSTLFNVINKVLGDYAGKIPAESLTTKAKNIKVDLAELFGKRFVLASETEEGQRLSNQMLKQIASTDMITAEKKYHDPFTFEPSHSAVLYTNFLPSLGSLDKGTKRRIIICPFKAEITSPIKDYAERLFKESSGVILKWLVEGAKKYYEASYNLPKCKVCDDAKNEYIADNDWLSHFIDDCCVVGKMEKQSSGELYKAYRSWCEETGEYSKKGSDFTKALQLQGFELKKTSKCNEWLGISIDPTKSTKNASNSTFL